MIPEPYRQKFRKCEKVSGHTYVEFARSKEQLFEILPTEFYLRVSSQTYVEFARSKVICYLIVVAIH